MKKKKKKRICLPMQGTRVQSLVRKLRFHVLWNVLKKKRKVKVTQSSPTLCGPVDYTVHGTLQARILEWVPFPFPRDLPNPGIEPSSPALQTDSLPAKSQGKPKNTGVGSLSLLWGIFPTQELNWDLQHCRKILYQLICTKCAQKRKEGGHKKVTRRHGMIIHL